MDIIQLLQLTDIDFNILQFDDHSLVDRDVELREHLVERQHVQLVQRLRRLELSLPALKLILIFVEIEIF
jgi:hypothetical protein